MDGDGACGKGGYKYYYQSYSTVRPLSAPPLPLQQLRSEASLAPNLTYVVVGRAATGFWGELERADAH